MRWQGAGAEFGAAGEYGVLEGTTTRLRDGIDVPRVRALHVDADDRGVFHKYASCLHVVKEMFEAKRSARQKENAKTLVDCCSSSWLARRLGMHY
ncbi:hypothetical protein DOTSEDRAFT_40264 [Dothistroma septosporum NZE10]|uniref:Uncharacterized protein n=1 Tax=Dothistroma septosporum (strain NZE10 / CBS 128990) TaxID=675120 RepID=N1Q3K6_DOTSN|nr:hypothetical protein DOTSEDRAFT_40264 [Dothistroma septosporum NZE10]